MLLTTPSTLARRGFLWKMERPIPCCFAHEYFLQMHDSASKSPYHPTNPSNPTQKNGPIQFWPPYSLLLFTLFYVCDNVNIAIYHSALGIFFVSLPSMLYPK